MSKLVIVESPAKAKTIKKYLGKNYEVAASVGHIRDLPSSKIAIDFENNFEPKYTIIKGKAPLVKELKKKVKEASCVYLATDPDREGEAISWHLAAVLGLDLNDTNRITFNEITKSAVTGAIGNARKIDINLVDAQQARRILDRIVGYKVSPFLWKKIRSGLSAGRVQSVATKLIVDRENEIRNFEAKEYWNIEAELENKKKSGFIAKFYGIDGKKTEINDKATVNSIVSDIENSEFIISDIAVGERSVSPSAPFITSTMQQEASRRFGYQPSVTMRIAQSLYEGIELGKLGHTGLITYMRTDSYRISDEAKMAAKALIESKYGREYYKSRVYKSKNAAQDAHEAIRPSDVNINPEDIKNMLTAQQYKIYKLIWERFVASQMANAVYETTKVDVSAGKYLFKASGQKLIFAGFSAVYMEMTDEKEEKSLKLPKLENGEKVNLKKLNYEQKFTQPPARYSDATLVKLLEEKGIGRPSTYAPIISTILERGYVEREKRTLKPTELGEITTGLMVEHFKDIVDVKFTAKMEDSLDEIEAGDKAWRSVVGDFYEGFEKTIDAAMATLDGTKIKLTEQVTDVICENCGRNMVIKQGRFGKFLACPGYPECKNTKALTEDAKGECPLCGSKILKKKSKKGKIYFGCEKNPSCSFMSWDEPIDEKCPKCGKTLLKKNGKIKKIHCSNENCDYERGI